MHAAASPLHAARTAPAHCMLGQAGMGLHISGKQGGCASKAVGQTGRLMHSPTRTGLNSVMIVSSTSCCVSRPADTTVWQRRQQQQWQWQRRNERGVNA